MPDLLTTTKLRVDSARRTSVYDCTLIDLPRHVTKGGHITSINNGRGLIPFDIRRVYYLYDIPGGEGRGSHAHKELEQIFIAASGSFEIKVDDGITKRTYQLSRPYFGLYLPPGLWRELANFSSGSICLVLVSDLYKADDYIHDYDSFLRFKGHVS